MPCPDDALRPTALNEAPIDPDVDASKDARHRRAAQDPPSSWWPRLHRDILAVVFVGGCVGGYARFAVTTAWTSGSAGFPWSMFAVNVTGAFLLALVVVIASDIRPSRYLRPLLGTGFCGALTTMSSLVVATDRLVAAGHPGTAAAYLGATTVAALAAAAIGLTAGRALAAHVDRGDGAC